ncbi:MAG: DUF1801 domain-containing protein [Acidimicrobiales bacterium]
MEELPNGTVLLSGGNPQIAKGDGRAPVQAYLDAMPGWKGEIGRRLDALILDEVPDVTQAVRWNSPFYGIEDNGWFLSMHCMTRVMKVTWLNGAISNRSHPRIRSIQRFDTQTSTKTTRSTTNRFATGSAKRLSCPETRHSEEVEETGEVVFTVC